jgi:hypothetical protein
MTRSNARPLILIDLGSGAWSVVSCEAEEIEAAQLAGHAAMVAARNVFSVASGGAPPIGAPL